MRNKFQKGHKINLGRHRTEELKQKLRVANLGKKLSAEHRQKISDGLKGNHNTKGQKWTEEQKNKLKGTRTGSKSFMYGREVSLETRKKMSENAGSHNLGKHLSEETKRKIGDKNRGKKASLETRKKISLAGSGRIISIKTRIKMGLSHRGEKNPLWKGGVTPKNEKIRKSLEMELWKKACIERDNFTCQKTGERGGKLQVHHINNFADYPELRTAIENGITLSKRVHQDFHKKYGIKNNTREQLLEFLNKK